MDHLASILERAERDGNVRRLRPAAEPSAAPKLEHLSPIVTPVVVEPVAAAPIEAAEAAPATRGAVARLHPSVVVGTAPESLAADRYRSLGTRILHADNGVAVQVLLVTSPASSDGKSVTAANVAMTLAQANERRVCLVDANLRSPQVDRLFGLPRQPGLGDVVAGQVRLDQALVRIEGRDLTILPAGTAHARPSELMGTSAMRRTLDDLRTRFDCVLVDSPAALPLADVGSLAPLVDSVLLVIRAGVTSKSAIRDAAAVLGHTAILGMVLNEAA
jgi:capsular exopolysaccharide synthesis family protein